MSNPKLTCYGGVGSVTGANFMIEYGGKKVLVDCGLAQGSPEADAENHKPFAYDPAGIDILLVTHGHLDHVGRIGKLVKDGFKGVIYSTSQTFAIAQYIMEDAVILLEKDARQKGVLTIYDKEDVAKALTMWKTIEYHTPVMLYEGFSLYAKDAGHILGSSMFECSFTVEKGITKVVFTGDLGNSPSPLLRDTESIEGAEYLIMESVYGDRNHESKDERRAKLIKVIQDTFSRGGTLVIPAFSVERTQVLLYELNDVVESGAVPELPVYIDSPLATKVTEVYRSNTHVFNEETQKRIKGGDDVFAFPRLKFVANSKDSQSIDRNMDAKIIIAGSGMSSGGRVRQHESAYLPEAKNTILLVGYQPLGTLGRLLQNGEKKVSIDGEKVPVRAHIEEIFGYSAHKDSDNLVKFVATGASSLKKVFIAMGEPKSALFLAQRLHDEIGISTVCPEKGVTYELI
ncbi:MAG: MBL fold metallo-hydrolase [Candidatus Taylorbacteria bacterium]|nr:MBL fold metallo-hydrolase [Candidatus Taylorbacteria bacterium]